MEGTPGRLRTLAAVSAHRGPGQPLPRAGGVLAPGPQPLAVCRPASAGLGTRLPELLPARGHVLFSSICCPVSPEAALGPSARDVGRKAVSRNPALTSGKGVRWSSAGCRGRESVHLHQRPRGSALYQARQLRSSRRCSARSASSSSFIHSRSARMKQALLPTAQLSLRIAFVVQRRKLRPGDVTGRELAEPGSVTLSCWLHGCAPPSSPRSHQAGAPSSTPSPFSRAAVPPRDLYWLSWEACAIRRASGLETQGEEAARPDLRCPLGHPGHCSRNPYLYPPTSAYPPSSSLWAVSHVPLG